MFNLSPLILSACDISSPMLIYHIRDELDNSAYRLLTLPIILCYTHRRSKRCDGSFYFENDIVVVGGIVR